MRSTLELAAADRRHLWHPFTQQQSWCQDEPPVVIEQADGTRLYDTEGNAYIDGVSSLWCNVHGHRHPAIDRAIKDQLDRVAHTTMLGLSHEPAIKLAESLVAIAPPGLTRVFYSDSGSTAVEVALKMAFQWWAQRGEQPDAQRAAQLARPDAERAAQLARPDAERAAQLARPDAERAAKPARTGFICLENAYHGDTVGSVSVGGIDTFRGLYEPLLFETWRARAGDAEHLADLLEQHGRSTAAVVVEPLVQGAAGMLMQPPGYLRQVRELCDAHDVLLICDEVATGFGRTGRMFACEHEDVAPDLLCVGKGRTGGYLPLAATLTTERVYEGFLGRPDELRTFFHGHTYTGNPLACAAAIATLELFQGERTLELLQPKIELLARSLAQRVAVLPGVRQVRQRGFMVGIELVGGAPGQAIGHQVTLAARRRGAIIRPLGDVVVLMPSLSIAEADLLRLVAITASSIAEVGLGRLATAA